MNQFSLEVRN